MTTPHHDHHEGNFLTKVAYLDSQQRKQSLSPADLLSRVAIKPTDTFLDVGAGTGFLTLPASKLVPQGRVYALDMSGKMLDLIEKQAREASLPHIETVLGQLEEIPLASDSVNHVLASLVLHEVPKLEEALAEIYRVLAVGGDVVCLELNQEKQMSHHHPRLEAVELVEKLENTGFVIQLVQEPTENLYVIVAKKDKA